MRSLLPILSLSIALNCLCAAAWAQSPSEGDTTASTTETKPESKSSDGGDAPSPAETLSDKLLTPEPAATASDGPLKRSNRWHDRRFPTSSGAIGIDRTMTATVGVVDTFRLRAGLGGFSTSDFPIDGADNDFLETSLSLGYTPAEFVEVYFSVGGTSNTNSLGRPELIQTQGDVSVGGKFVGEISPMVTAGGALNLHLLSDVGAGGFAWGATSVEARGLLSVDLKKTENEPLRFNVNLGYLMENSEGLDNGLSSEPTLVQEFGLQTSRYDRLTLGLGLEVPLDEPVVPFAEYEVALPILVELGRRSDDSNDYSFFSVPHSVALGLRGYATENLAIETSVRFGLSDQPYTGVPATPPWLLSFAVAYHLDPLPIVVEKTVETAAKVPVVAPAPALKTFNARVVDQKTKEAVPNVTVIYMGQVLTPQVTGPNGHFQSYPLEDGEVGLQLTADGYKPANVRTQVGADSEEVAVFMLEKDPNDKRGKLILNIKNDRGRNIAAAIQFGGSARDISGRANTRGVYERVMKPGRYPVTVNARGYAEVTRTLVVTSGKDTIVDLKLEALKPVSRPEPVAATPSRGGGGGGLAVVTTKAITLKRPVSFTKGSADLTGEAKRVLRSVARGLKNRKSISKVRVDVHTSGRGPKAEQLRLSRKRAKSIKSFLVSNGVDRKRIRVRGSGGNKPLAPPITKRGRQKNERVEFKILKVK